MARDRANITIAMRSKVLYCHRMTTLQMFYIVTLTHIFEVTRF